MKYLIFLSILGFFASCTVQNNLYLNNPKPLGKGKTEVYGGLSTGVRPKVDSIGQAGQLDLSDKFGLSPNLSFGANFGLTNRIDLGVDMHLPYIIGGFGLNVRPQISLLPTGSKVNVAIAGRAGFVAAKDTFNIGGFSATVDDLLAIKGSLNASIAMPVGIKIMEDTWFILTPRLTTTRYVVRDIINDALRKMPHVINTPVLSIGVRHKNFHFETSLLRLEQQIAPTFGIVYISDFE